MRDKTREAMRMFLGGRCYTAENLERDFLSELTRYSDERWEAPQRGARLAAVRIFMKGDHSITSIEIG
ncbi:TPA: hypothetical protein ACM46D_003849 [Escherichia coli]